MATSAHFSVLRTVDHSSHSSTLPKLSSQGNLLSGAVARVAVGFVLNPFTVLKARYEVHTSSFARRELPSAEPPCCPQSNLHNYQSLFGALRSLVRAGPSEAFLGFLPSALRDAPYAGFFIVFYEAIKHETGDDSAHIWFRDNNYVPH